MVDIKSEIMDQSRHQFVYGYNNDARKEIVDSLEKDYPAVFDSNKPMAVNIKDLGVINRDIKDLIIIDNNAISYAMNKENGIPILSWYDDPNDNELIKLIPLMKYLASVNDVRPIINKIVISNFN